MKAIKRIIILIVVLALITLAGVAYLKYRSAKETKTRNDDIIATTNISTDTYADSYQNTTEGSNMVKFDDRAARFADCTEQEILDAVAQHYYLKHGVSDVLVRLDSIDGDIWLIQVYEDMGDHENTYDWYTIDRVVASGTTMFGQENVDLASLLNRDPVYIYVEDSPELADRHGYRADGSSIEYYTSSSYDAQYDYNEQSSSTTTNDSGTYILSEGKFYVGYEDGQILPGTYGLRVEGDTKKHYAHLAVHHLHSVADYYTFGEGENGADMLFNEGLLDFYVNEGDYIEYAISMGEPVVTIYLK